MKIQITVKAFALLFAVVVLFAPVAHAQKHGSLVPLLIDLKGWEANKAEGMSMDMGAMKMTNATRNYTRDDRNITAMVMIGSSSMTQGQMQSMKAESDDAKVTLSNIDGFQVQILYDKTEGGGSVVVFLSQKKAQSAMFVMSYEGLSEKEALDFAKKFNWKKMKGAVDKLL